MNVIPAINCLDFECVEKHLDIIKGFLPPDGWVHLDVADARFTFNKTWGDPEKWKEVGKGLNLEVHLMVEEPEYIVPRWLEAGAKRVILHVEAVANLEHIVKECRAHGAEVMLSTNPETPAERIKPHLAKLKWLQVLAVNPGFAGQRFLPTVLEKIKFLRGALPDANIEVDGGINNETARLVKEAGAGTIVAASYIFGSDNPKLAYAMLTQI